MTDKVFDFLDDIDKVYDLLDTKLSKKEFLKTYSYLTEEEYNLSVSNLYADLTGNIAQFFRTAENMFIEENTEMGGENPYAYANVTAEEFKSRIYDFMNEVCTEQEIEEIREIADSTGV